MNLLIFSLRWLLLVVVALLYFAQPNPPGASQLMLALLAVTVFYNIGLVILEFVEYAPAFLSWFLPVADSVLALSLFAASDASAGPLIWIGLLPGLTTALRHRATVGLSVIAAFTLAQAVLILALSPDNYGGLASLALTALVLWPATLAAARLARRLRTFIQAVSDTEHKSQTQIERALRAHARALYEMSSMVSATLDYEKVLDAALNFGAFGAEGSQQQAYSLMTSAVLTFREDQLRMASGWRLPPADHRVLCPAREGVLGQVIRTSEPAVISDPSRDPELEQFVGFRNCRSLMALPLRAGFETYGVVLYGHPRVDFFDQDKRAFLIAVVNQAIIALQNAQLYRNLREEKERLVEVQEEAQKKLARDLHDGPTQSVAALAMRANFARRLVERDPKAAADELFKMEDLARRTTKEIRHMLFTLRPLVLESQGLTAALQQLAEKMRETHSQNVIVEAEPGLEDRLELNQQGVLFYIVEEAVGNARKHAQAQHIWVRLKTQRDVLVLEIQDDGVGFNVGAVNASYDKRGSLGMVNMRERAEMLSGAVKIDSAEGRGTRVTVLVPLNEIVRT
jgi:signal transduction histidine kinase